MRFADCVPQGVRRLIPASPRRRLASATSKPDGGWGEHFRSCLRQDYVEHPQSQSTMTKLGALIGTDKSWCRDNSFGSDAVWIGFHAGKIRNGSYSREAAIGVFFGIRDARLRFVPYVFPCGQRHALNEKENEKKPARPPLRLPIKSPRSALHSLLRVGEAHAYLPKCKDDAGRACFRTQHSRNPLCVTLITLLTHARRTTEPPRVLSNHRTRSRRVVAPLAGERQPLMYLPRSHPTHQTSRGKSPASPNPIKVVVVRVSVLRNSLCGLKVHLKAGSASSAFAVKTKTRAGGRTVREAETCRNSFITGTGSQDAAETHRQKGRPEQHV